MAHTLGDYSEINSRAIFTTAPASFAFYCNSGSTLLTLSIVVGGATIRSGTAPTYGGSLFTQANSVAIFATTPETNAEMWYLLKPTQVTSLRINIPLTAGSRVVHNVLATALAQPGWTSVFDEAKQLTGNAANPGSGTFYLSPTGSGDFTIVRIGHGNASVPTGRSQTLLIAEDHGAYVSEAQYAIPTNPGSIGFSFTVATEDWGMIGAAFREQLDTPPTVVTGSATSITNSSAVLGGGITQIWGVTAVARGFVYDIASKAAPGNVMPSSAGYTFTTSYTGAFIAETFVGSVSGLTPNTLHLFRAWAQNSFGYGYGLEQSFTSSYGGVFTGSSYLVTGSGTGVFTGTAPKQTILWGIIGGVVDIAGTAPNTYQAYIPSTTSIYTVVGTGQLLIAGGHTGQVTMYGTYAGQGTFGGTAPNTYQQTLLLNTFSYEGGGLLQITGSFAWARTQVWLSSGTLTITGSVGQILSRVPAASGLLTITGSVGQILSCVPSAAGLLTAIGHAPGQATLTSLLEGVATFGGTAPNTYQAYQAGFTVNSYQGSGLLQTAGQGYATQAYGFGGTGTLLTGGTGNKVVLIVVDAAGSVSMGGEGTEILVAVPPASGSLQISGTATVQFSSAKQGSGAGILGGAAVSAQTLVPSASGVLTTAGMASLALTAIELGSGSGVFTGAAVTALIPATGTFTPTASGLAIFSGEAIPVTLRVSQGSGILQTAGAGTSTQGWVAQPPTGGIQTAGGAQSAQTLVGGAVGGAILGGVGSVVLFAVPSASGSLQIGGTAPPTYIPVTGGYQFTGAGVLQIGGSAGVAFRATIVSTGGVQITGDGVSTQSRTFPASGTIQTGGTGTSEQGFVAVGSGGLVISGTGWMVFRAVELGSGLLEISGTGSDVYLPVTGGFNPTASGTAAFSGGAIVSRTISPEVTGGIQTQGEGRIVVSRTLQGLGLLTADGQSGVQASKTFQGTGQGVLNGDTPSSTVHTFPVSGGGTTGGAGSSSAVHVYAGTSGILTEGSAPQAISLAILGLGTGLFTGQNDAQYGTSEVNSFPGPFHVYIGLVPNWLNAEIDIVIYHPDFMGWGTITADTQQVSLDIS